ncbi:hypothetical protein H9W91_07170 [Streptomyces alfalfae]|nr:hypothetical protein [Streptomyces alfalfae]QUI30667.1 hypothetical protein H9W91_07170 [Streptomyces alfalfae]
MNDDGEASTRKSHSREWRGNHRSWVDSFKRYDFPVTVRKIEKDNTK